MHDGMAPMADHEDTAIVAEWAATTCDPASRETLDPTPWTDVPPGDLSYVKPYESRIQ